MPQHLWHRVPFGAVAAAAGTALAMAVPTDVLDTGLFTRMTPVRWWEPWVIIAMAGLVFVWAALPSACPSRARGRTAVATLGGALAVGCPVCNKIVVAAIGASGALSVWAPLQPLFAVGSLLLAATAVIARWRAGRRCGVPNQPVGDHSVGGSNTVGAAGGGRAVGEVPQKVVG